MGYLSNWKREPDIIAITEKMTYYSERYGKSLTIPASPEYPFLCDGASGVPNVGRGWIFHDWAYWRGLWDDGTPITFREANQVLGDILKEEGHWVRAQTWKWGTDALARVTWNRYRTADIKRERRRMYSHLYGD